MSAVEIVGVGMGLKARQTDGCLEVTEIVPNGPVHRSDKIRLGDVLRRVRGSSHVRQFVSLEAATQHESTLIDRICVWLVTSKLGNMMCVLVCDRFHVHVCIYFCGCVSLCDCACVRSCVRACACLCVCSYVRDPEHRPDPQVNGKEVGKTVSSARDLLMGPPGTAVSLGIVRQEALFGMDAVRVENSFVVSVLRANLPDSHHRPRSIAGLIIAEDDDDRSTPHDSMEMQIHSLRAERNAMYGRLEEANNKHLAAMEQLRMVRDENLVLREKQVCQQMMRMCPLSA